MSLAAMVLADRGEHLIRFYDRWVGLITWGRADRVRDMVLSEIGPGQRVLDFGCGTGTLAVAAARSGADVVAVDRSSTMLSLARKKAAKARVTVDWRQGDIVFPPLYGERFDVAVATYVLGELSAEEASLALRRMAESLRPGGRLIIADEVPAAGLLRRSLTGMTRSLLSVVSFVALQQVAPPRRHPWRDLFAQAGLQVASERPGASGSLVVFVAVRPPSLPPLQRTIRNLDEVLPSGPRRCVLRAAAWFALPIAVRPGVYRIGDPGAAGPVLLTGNYLASVEAVHSALAGRDAYLAVEDSHGWNVWCASDAGLFDAEKAAALVELHGLDGLVEPRRMIIPRLGGRIRSRLTALTGWEVIVGPIEARDLPEFMAAGLSPAMHSLRRGYGLPERIRVGALTLVQLLLFLLPLRFVAPSLRRPALRFAMVASWVLPLAHDRLPGRTGVVKAMALAGPVALLGATTGRIRPSAALTILAVAPLVGWVYQSSSPVVFWKRLWR